MPRSSLKHRRRVALVACSVIAATILSAPIAEADLIPGTFIETDTFFSASAGDTNTAPAAVGGGVKWHVVAAQMTIDGVGANNDIVVYGQHQVGPHTNDIVPNSNIVLGWFLNVVPGANKPNFTNYVTHPTDPHYDIIHLTYKMVVAGTSQLTIGIKHSETPGSAQPTAPSGIPSQPPEPTESWRPRVAVPALSTAAMAALSLLLLAGGIALVLRFASPG